MDLLNAANCACGWQGTRVTGVPRYIFLTSVGFNAICLPKMSTTNGAILDSGASGWICKFRD